MHFYVRLTSIAFICIGLVLVLTQVISRLINFTHIFGAHAGIALTQEEVLNLHNQTTDERPQVVPKIIHQIFHNWKDPGNNTLPSDWEIVRQTCIAHNPDWDHRLWTEKESHEFIQKEYPWFLDTYDAYRFPVQRVDSLKYFLMRHYGGIYIDLDNGCDEELSALLYFSTWVTDGGHGALSNNILGAQPDHPFWHFITDSLMSYNWNYLFPYMIVHYGSGQWYETAIWEEYHESLSQNGTQALEHSQLYRIMMDMRPGSAKWVFFTQGRGGTWDQWDNHFFGWIGSHVPQIELYVALFIAFLLSCCVCWCRFRRRQGYQPLANQPSDDAGVIA